MLRPIILAVALAVGLFVPAFADCDWASDDPVDKVVSLCTAVAEDTKLSVEERAEAYQNLGVIYYRKVMTGTADDAAANEKNLALALQNYDRAIRLDPQNAGSFTGRADIHVLKKDYAKAIAGLNEGLQENPDDESILNSRASVWGAMKDYDRQIADYTAMIARNPQGIYYQFRAEAWQAKGEGDKAAADLKQYEALKSRQAPLPAGSGEEQTQLRFGPDNMSIEPVEAPNSTYYVARDTAVYEQPAETAAAVKTLSRGEKLLITGRTRNSRKDKERWFVVAYADRKERFVKGADLLNERDYETRTGYLTQKGKLERQRDTYLAPFDAIRKSPKGDRNYVGFYSLGEDCNLAPAIVKKIGAFSGANLSAQAVQYAFWAVRSYFFWTDDRFSYFAHPFWGTAYQFRYRLIVQKSYQNIGRVTVFRQEPVDAAAKWPAELAAIGLTENGKLLLGVKLANKNRNITWAGMMTRCNSAASAKAAVTDIYERYLKTYEDLLADLDRR